MSNKTKDLITYFVLVIILILFVVGLVYLSLIASYQKEQNEQNAAELKEAVRQRSEREQYIIECVKAELNTDSEVKLTFFKYEGYTNGYINHYIAEVEGRCYVVSATYTDKLVNVVVVSEI